MLEEVSNLGLDNGIEYFILLCTLEVKGLFAGACLYLRDLALFMRSGDDDEHDGTYSNTKIPRAKLNST